MQVSQNYHWFSTVCCILQTIFSKYLCSVEVFWIATNNEKGKEELKKVCHVQSNTEYLCWKTLKNIFLTLMQPLTPCSDERLCREMNILKPWMRSTMVDDRLTGLALTYIHKNIEIDMQAIISDFALSKNKCDFVTTAMFCKKNCYTFATVRRALPYIRRLSCGNCWLFLFRFSTNGTFSKEISYRPDVSSTWGASYAMWGRRLPL